MKRGRNVVMAVAVALGIDANTVEKSLEAVKKRLERDVIYTGGFNLIGKAVIAECHCSKCGQTFWNNYCAPRPFCVDCDPPIIYRRSPGVGRDADPIEEAERRYHGGRRKLRNLCHALPVSRVSKERDEKTSDLGGSTRRSVRQ